MNEKQVKHISVRLPLELWRRSKLELFKNGKSFQGFVVAKLQELLEDRKPHVSFKE